jgi:predicted RNase H-related nuclease YkuK (DUF458 family)
VWSKEKKEFDRFDEMLKDVNNPDVFVYVGTDSHSYGNEWLFATVICCHVPGHGGRIYKKRLKFSKNAFQTLYDRLLHEVYLSIEIAQEIEKLTGKKPQVHVDIAKQGTKSAKFYSNITSYVLGMGFMVTCKPDSWASSSIADRYAR